MVRPILEYGTNIWTPVFKKYLTNIEQVQKRATKFITCDYLSNYKTRLMSCDILPLSYRREYLDANLLYKTIHGACNLYILSKIVFSTLRNNAQVDNCNVGNLLPMIANTEIYKHF